MMVTLACIQVNSLFSLVVVVVVVERKSEVGGGQDYCRH
jgi:hypothetical protein